LRDQRIKKRQKTKKSRYISAILLVLKPQMRLLDIGCGTGHIIQELATNNRSPIFVGLDISPAMVKIAKSNTVEFHNIRLVEGDGFKLPFPSCTFDVITTRLADYSQKEAYRVLRRRGCFFECSLGPDSDKEIKEFFPERIEKENFFFPKDLKQWKQEVCEDIIEAGFTITDIDDYKETNYYENQEELMDLIEMIPLVRDFDRKEDEMQVRKLVAKYTDWKGVRITWHYYILLARKP